MRIILWTIATIVSSMANGKFLLWQNDPYIINSFDVSSSLKLVKWNTEKEREENVNCLN